MMFKGVVLCLLLTLLGCSEINSFFVGDNEDAPTKTCGAKSLCVPDLDPLYSKQYSQLESKIPSDVLDFKDLDHWLPLFHDYLYVDASLIYSCDVIGEEPCTPIYRNPVEGPDLSQCKFNSTESTDDEGVEHRKVIALNRKCPVELDYQHKNKLNDGELEKDFQQSYFLRVRNQQKWPTGFTIRTLRSQFKGADIITPEKTLSGGHSRLEIATFLGNTMTYEMAFQLSYADPADTATLTLKTISVVEGGLYPFGGTYTMDSSGETFSINRKSVSRAEYESVLGPVDHLQTQLKMQKAHSN
ncbi:MAG: hypothetical protein CL677_05270 [Bdellovibrionaceae bacterium]|nr:hypothetical protein [Pseudobdellovibrionaceae bacterium]|tara:strand:+ start:59502 stop:60401 length:900 start_codon:yes stop_codon:yes gene_type:complete